MAEFDRSTGSAAARSVGSSAPDGGVDSAHTVLNLADETNAAAATLQAVPVSLGKYQLRQKLGSGAMGAVYRVRSDDRP
jgi:hypothetical protein